ncbi:MFS transporter (plasmid) [Priestia megaterium]|nr:MFS transporter [Priestia megaterium]
MIQKDLQLNSFESGLILSIFFISYALMQPIGGWLTDKYGSQKILILSILEMWIKRIERYGDRI